MLTCTPRKVAMTSGRWRFDGSEVRDNLTGNTVRHSDDVAKWPSVVHLACYYGDSQVKVIGIYQTDEGFIWREKGKS